MATSVACLLSERIIRSLKPKESFRPLQQRITGLEEAIADRRELYNDEVKINNTRIDQFPDALIARRYGIPTSGTAVPSAGAAPCRGQFPRARAIALRAYPARLSLLRTTPRRAGTRQGHRRVKVIGEFRTLGGVDPGDVTGEMMRLLLD